MPEVTGPQPLAAQHHPRIVVVDDSVSVCRAVERMVAMRGAQVVSIHTGEEALVRLEQEAPDLVICDLVLPDVEGFDVCRFVRGSALLNKVPVLAITGLASDDARRRALEAGADKVLQKPFRSEVLLADIDALLRTARELAREPVAAELPQPAELLQPAEPPQLAGPPQPAEMPQPTKLPQPPELPQSPELPKLPVPSELPGAAQLILNHLNALDGLASCVWRLANGAQGEWALATAPAGDPAAMLEGLRAYAASLGIAQPAMAVLEDEGCVVLLARRERCGFICLRLENPAVLGKARLLVRRFLSHLDRFDPPTSMPSENGPTPSFDRAPRTNQRS